MNAESSTKNFFLSFLLLFFASVAGWLLYQELNQSAIFSGKEPVGKVLYQEKGLQRRYHNDTHWEKISKETILYDQDSIRTQKGSSGILSLHFQNEVGEQVVSQLVMEENTFLTLSFSDHSGVKLESGMLSVTNRGEKGNGAISITSEDRKILVAANSQLSIQKNLSGQTSLALQSGVADLKMGGKSAPLQVNEAIELDSGSAQIVRKKLLVVPQFPHRGYRAIFFEREKKQSFQWKSISSLQKLDLEIASTKDFIASRRFEVSGLNRFDCLLPAGNYFWRLVAHAKEELFYSEVQPFALIQEPLIQPISPANRKEFFYRKKIPTIVLSATTLPFADSYRVEISDSPQFEKIAYAKEGLSSPYLTLSNFSQGNWYWRIRPYYTANQMGYGPSSEIFSFTLKKRNSAIVPALISPINGEKFTLYQEKIKETHSPLIQFNWNRDSELTQYDFSLWREGGSEKSPLVKRRLSLHYLTLSLEELAGVGNYFWKVDGVTDEGEFFLSNQRASFSIHSFSPKIVATYPQANELFLLDELKPICFQWDSNLSENLIIEIFREGDLNRPFIQERSFYEKEKEIFLREAGRYFWQVRHPDLGKSGKSELRAFTLLVGLEKPQILSPFDNESIVLDSARGLLFSWRAVESADFYEISLYEFHSNRLVASQKKWRALNWHIPSSGLLEKGRYRLRVSAVSKNPYGTWHYSPYAQISFSIQKILSYQPPVLQQPSNANRFSLDEVEQGGVFFQWQQKPALSRFFLDLSRSADFVSFEKSIYCDSVSCTIGRLKEGQYYWRVRSYDEEHRLVATSTTFQFEILPSTRKTLLKEEWIEQEKSFAVESELKEKEKIAFEQQIRKEVEAEIQESVEAEIRKKAEAQIREQIQAEIQQQIEDSLRVDETPKDEKKKKEQNKAIALSKKEPPQLLSPQKQETFSIREEKEGIGFSWKGNKIYESYQFQIAKTTDFRDPIVSEETVAKKYFTQRVMDEGLYFWRVRGIQADYGVDVASEVRSLVITKIAGQLTPLTPGNGEVYLLDSMGRISLSWKSTVEAPFLVELFDANRLDRPLAVQNSLTPYAEIFYPQSGRYCWKVSSVDPSGDRFWESEWFTFDAYMPLEKPFFFSPHPDSKFPYKEVKVIPISWKAVPMATSYSISIINLKNQKEIVSYSTVSTFYDLKEAGDFSNALYQIKLQANFDIQNQRIVSPVATSSFSIVKGEGDRRAAKLFLPRDRSHISAMSALERPILFQWSSIDENTLYRFELSKDSGFSELLHYQKVMDTSIEIADLSPGYYHWRVWAENLFDGTEIKSERFSFSIPALPELAVPQWISPYAGADIALEGKTSLDFSWKKVPSAEGYLLSFYRETGEVIFEKRESAKPFYSFPFYEKPVAGNYYAILTARKSIASKKYALLSKPTRIDFSLHFGNNSEKAERQEPLSEEGLLVD